MERWIERPPEPDRLVLLWRPPLHNEERYHWAVGELVRISGGGRFRYFDGAEFEAANGGRSEDDARAAGFRGYPAFRWPQAQPVEHQALEAFMRRLPPRSRSDFIQFLAHHRLAPGVQISDFALLGLTAAKLPGDGFSLIDPLTHQEGRFQTLIEVVGGRHHALADRPPAPGAPVRLVREPDNAFDPHAVRLEVDGAIMGYVSRLQAPAVGRWAEADRAQAWVLRCNGTSADPRLHLFVEVEEAVAHAVA